jgi:hypothetical protein
MKSRCCILLILFAGCIFGQEKPQFGSAGEGYSATNQGSSIELGWRMFTAPMGAELCRSKDEKMTLDSSVPIIRLASGDVFSLKDLNVNALDGHGNFLARVQITVGIPAVEDGFLDYRPYDLTLTARKPGRLPIEIAGYCVPTSRLYLSLLVEGANELLSLGLFTIALPDGWHHTTETQPNKQVVTQIFHPDKEGVLQISSTMHAPRKPTQNIIRIMTNVDSSVDLTWQKWGGLSGYHYDYTEAGTFYRQWWLTHRNKILFVVYSSKVKNESMRHVIDEMVSSLAVSE